MLDFDGEYLAENPKRNFDIGTTKLQKVNCKTFNRSINFTEFYELV